MYSAISNVTDMNDFVEKSCDSYVVDLPTGMTPQKKTYDYPRNLSATSPHERIISRFTSRKEQEENKENEIF